jgi:hypothetical protein
LPAGNAANTIDLATLGAQGELVASVDVAFIVNREISIPNMISMFFTTTLPAGLLQPGTTVVQYAQYAPKDGSMGGAMEGVVCKTVIGDASQYEILSYAGSTALGSSFTG